MTHSGPFQPGSFYDLSKEGLLFSSRSRPNSCCPHIGGYTAHPLNKAAVSIY